MASVRRTPSGSWELTIRSRLLPRPRYLTFDTEEAALRYGQQADALLAAGVVPAALITEPVRRLATVAEVIRGWRAEGTLSALDDEVLPRVAADVGATRLDQLTFAWVDAWVKRLKRVDNLAPGSVRKRVGALLRALDWWLRSHPEIAVQNPLRLLPRGYAAYTSADARELATGRVAKADGQRDRRLTAAEEAALERVLAGGRRPDRERPLAPEPAFVLLYRLILATGVRLREAYTLRAGQVGETTIRVQAGKMAAGVVEYRAVPLVRSVRAPLAAHVAGMAAEQLVFPWWDGEAASLPRVTSLLSRRFGTLFAYAGVPDFTEHDLRHEATCRWFEMRAADGNWLYREAEIRRIMGWSARSPMPARYASFRAEDLAARL